MIIYFRFKIHMNKLEEIKDVAKIHLVVKLNIMIVRYLFFKDQVSIKKFSELII